jgi:hypothetical protein
MSHLNLLAMKKIEQGNDKMRINFFFICNKNHLHIVLSSLLPFFSAASGTAAGLYY